MCTGKMTTFGGQSRYQLVVNDIEIAGEGALLKQLEDRRRRLAEEGLFDTARKRPLPRIPATIGVVTSPTGAVIRDILHRISERFPTRILVWGVNVQGVGSADQIAAAITGFNAMDDGGEVPRPDLLIVARGGGSLEDLWSFNEEVVVRAAAASVIPLISAVGHETDTTLIDYAADVRAPTPTAAAEFATPVAADLLAQLSETEARLRRAVLTRLTSAQQSVRAAERGLLHPEDLIGRLSQSVDLAFTRIDTGLYRRLDRLQLTLATLSDRLVSPEQRVGAIEQTVSILDRRLEHSLSAVLERADNQLSQTARLLAANSYQRVLDRGFALVTDQGGKPLKT
ncbi:MAG: exodeoxyribonuclease VII large subunit, partial [Alphaproteobacteria bacterium]|nr:exodeoxyribonuclease VII large subunit [Alphaproteobacteria bacterium]